MYTIIIAMEIQNMDWTKNNILFTPQENQLLMCFCFCFFELYTKVMCSRDWDFGDANIVTVTGQNCTVTGQNCTVKNKQTNVCPPLLRCVLNFFKKGSVENNLCRKYSIPHHCVVHYPKALQ